MGPREPRLGQLGAKIGATGAKIGGSEAKIGGSEAMIGDSVTKMEASGFKTGASIAHIPQSWPENHPRAVPHGSRPSDCEPRASNSWSQILQILT